MRTRNEWVDRYAAILIEEGWNGAGGAEMREADKRAAMRFVTELQEEIFKELLRVPIETALRTYLGTA